MKQNIMRPNIIKSVKPTKISKANSNTYKEQYDFWLKNYISDNKINIAEYAINEIIDETIIKLTVMDILNIVREYEMLAQDIRRKAMKAVYTNTSPLQDYREIILYNYHHGGKQFKAKIEEISSTH